MKPSRLATMWIVTHDAWCSIQSSSARVFFNGFDETRDGAGQRLRIQVHGQVPSPQRDELRRRGETKNLLGVRVRHDPVLVERDAQDWLDAASKNVADIHGDCFARPSRENV